MIVTARLPRAVASANAVAAALLASLVLAAAPCEAQESMALLFGQEAATAAAPEAEGLAPLSVGPCLDAPGCGQGDPAPEPLESDSVALRAELPEDPSPVPLPAALALMGAGMTAFALLRRRRARG